MNKAAARLRILNLMDDNCVDCEHRRDRNANHCWTKCEIGKEINALGTYLGGTKIKKEVKVRTPKDWDKLCIKILKMKREGMLYKDIAVKLGIKNPSCISSQLSKRGLK